MANPIGDQELLKITKTEQYRTVEELMERSRPSSIYYTLLVLSSFIIAAGLLLENAPIVIGGMLVTPVLIPVLVLALGISTGEVKILKSVGVLLVKSFLVIMAGSFLLAMLFGAPSSVYVVDNIVRIGILYFIVALASGVAATFAWIRKEISEVLPGISIAVSLVPPLSLVGISLSVLDYTDLKYYSVVFFFNLVGIIIGSLVVFSLLKFYKAEKEIKKEEKLMEKSE